jgi:hypothetical protein
MAHRDFLTGNEQKERYALMVKRVSIAVGPYLKFFVADKWNPG